MTWVMAALIDILVADVAAHARAARQPYRPLPPPEGRRRRRRDLPRVVCAPGVTVDAATRRAAVAWAKSQGLDVVDLVPRDLPAIEAMSLAQVCDLAQYRRDRLAPGRTAGHAILVTADVAERAGLGAEDPADEVAFVELVDSVAAPLRRRPRRLRGRARRRAGPAPSTSAAAARCCARSWARRRRWPWRPAAASG